MHKQIIAATAAAFLFAGAAWAGGNHVKGTIQSINTDQNQITLADGKVYKAEGVDLASLKAGDTVTIQVEEKNGESVVTKVTKG